MLGLGALIAVAGAAAVVAGSAAPASAASGTCSVFWTGATDTNWTVAANWATNRSGSGAGRVPLSSDVACMADSPTRTTVEYFSLSRYVAGIDFSVDGSLRPTLRIDGGRLTVGSAGGGAVDSIINNLELAESGELRGTADVTLTGTPVLDGDPVLSGSGTTTIAAGVDASTDGMIVQEGRRLVVAGELTHDDCFDYVYFYDGAVLDVAGDFTAASSCGMRVYSDGTQGSRVVVRSGATFRVVQPAADTYRMQGPLENHGVVDVATGSLVAAPMSTTDGHYSVGSGAQLMVATGGTLQVGSGTLTASRSVTVTGGTVEVADGVALSSVDLQSGTLTGDPTITTFTATPGTTITGGGVVTLAPGGTSVIDGLVIDGAQVRNKGTLTHVTCSAALSLRNGAKLVNDGTLRLPCGSTVTGDGSPGILVQNTTSGLIDGELPSSVQEYVFSARTTNDGAVEMAKGRIEFPNLTNFSAGTLSGGSYTVTGGLLQVPDRITTNDADITLASPGDLVVADDSRALLGLRTNSGTLSLSQGLTLNTPLTNSGTVNVNANTFKPKSYTQTAGMTFVANGATLSAANGANAIVVDGGTVTGGGRLGSLDGSGTARPDRTLSLLGQWNPDPGSTLEIRIDGNNAAGKLSVQGQAFLTGTLKLVTAQGYTPARGTSFTILTTSRLSGTFTGVAGQNLAGGNYYDVRYNSGSVTITVARLAQLTVTDGQSAVGPAGDVPMTFDVTLDGPSSQLVTADYATADVTATSLLDYLPVSGTLTFNPGETTRRVTVIVVRDLLFEPEETFALNLSNVSGAEASRSTAIGWINHEATAPTTPTVTGIAGDTLGLGANQVERTVRGENFQPNAVVTVSGTNVRVDSSRYVDPTQLVVTLSATTTTTTGANDITVGNPGFGSSTCAGCLAVTQRPVPTTTGLSLASGATNALLTVTGTDFVPGSSVKITGGTGVSTTTTYVSPTELQVGVTSIETATRGPWDVRVTNPDDGTGVCTGCFTLVDGPTATALTPPAVARASTTTIRLTGTGFAPGATLIPAQDIAFTDVTVMDGTTITATMTVGTNRARGAAIPITVVNPAAAGAGSAKCSCLEVASMISAADVTTTVGTTGPVQVTFDVRLDSNTPNPVSVDVATVDGTATAGSDYTPLATTLTFGSGVTSLPVTVTVLPDNSDEGTETFGLALRNPVGGALATTTAVATVLHDGGAAPAPTVSSVSGTVGIGATARQVTVIGTGFRPTSTVGVAATGVGVGAVEYVDDTRLLVTLSANTNAVPGARDVTVTTTGAGSGTCSGCLTVTPRPQPTATGLSLASGASSVALVVTGSDFQPGSSAKITGGTGLSASSTYVSPTEIQVTVSVTETATRGPWDIRVTNPDDGTGVCTGCFTVVDGPTVTALQPPAVARGSSTAIRLTGTGFVAGAVLVPPQDVAFSGVTVVDSRTITATMTVAADRARAAAIPITVVNPVAAGAGSAKCGCLEVASMISAADVTTTVGNTGPVQVTFDVRLDSNNPAPVTVDVATVDGTATAGSDYTPLSTRVTLGNGVTSVPVTVTVLADSAAEPDETFGLALRNPVGGALATTQATATIRHDTGAAPAPTVAGVSGTLGVGSSTRPLTVTGTGFRASTTVAVSGTGITVQSVQYVSATQLRVNLSASTAAAVGTRDLTATTPGAGSGTCAGCLRITPAAAASSAGPSLGTGAVERVVTINGTGFVTGAVPVFRGGGGLTVVRTEFVNATTLRATVTVAATAAPGRYDVRVTNPDGGTSLCAGCYTVLAGPTVSAMTPSVVVRGTSVAVVITGRNFASGATVTGPSGTRFTAVVVVNSSTITATLSVDLSRGRGSNLPITVINPASAGWGQGSGKLLSITLL